MASRIDKRRARVVKVDESNNDKCFEEGYGVTAFEELNMVKEWVTNKQGDVLLSEFFAWLVPPGWWPEFWARFRADGIMTWLEFEDFVHWEGRWTGDTGKVFEELAAYCGTSESEHPKLTAAGLLQLKAWWDGKNDKGIENFKRMFGEHYGNLGCAWRQSLDPEDTGSCVFLQFCRQCNSLGLRLNMKSTWEALTNGTIHSKMTYVNWDVVGDRLVSRFVMGLSIKYGGLREGWDTFIKNSGGHLCRSEFVEACIPFGIARHESEWLFAVLDSDRRRYLSEFDRLRFLQHWDPGPVRHMTLDDLKFATHAPPTKSSVQRGRRQELGQYEEPPFDLTSDNPYQFLLVLSKEELKEVKARQRSERLRIGLTRGSPHVAS